MSRAGLGLRGRPRYLTARQKQVLHLLLRGLSNKAVGQELHLAEGTVKCHVSALLRIYDAASRAQLIAEYLAETPPRGRALER